MHKKGLLLLQFIFLSATSFCQLPADLANPLIGTIKPRFDFFAAASLPYGMVSLHPDTHHGDLWNAGYRYNDTTILNFSHIHNTQTAGIPVMPVVGTCKALQGLNASKSRFTHEGEIAKPGYHKIYLKDYGITAELSSSLRAGFHRYTFPAAKEAHIIMDLTAALGPVKMVEGYAKQISTTEITGYSVMAPTFRRKKNCTVYFYARFSKPFNQLNCWGSVAGEPAKKLLNGTETKGKDAGVYASYSNLKAGEQVMLQVGISFVSMENARMNLEKEIPSWNFEETVAKAKTAWNEYLGRIEVSGGTKKQQVKFYTDLMHTAIGRRITEDVNGEYTDNTGTMPLVRKVPLKANGTPSFHFLDADGLWGAHWNLNILWPMVYPEYGNDLASTFLSYYKNTGVLARESWGGDMCWVMVGDQTVPLLAALMQTNQATFNKEDAYKGAYKNAFPGGIRDRAGYEAGPNPQGGGIDLYIKYGYVPIEIKDRGNGFHRGGAAMTLEYAYQDWCLANMAKYLKKDKNHEQLFTGRSANWKNIFDSATGFSRPKDSLGKWFSPFEPVGTSTSGGHATPGFIESNAAIYTYYVPQDVKALVQAMGGRSTFVKRLDESFTSAISSGFAAEHGEHWAAVVDYDNQPGCHLAHLFSYAGQPWKTQYWVRKVKEATFGDTTAFVGYRGDEDQGQMGSLSVLMAVGLFDVQGLADVNPTLEITSPIFDKITFHLPNKKKFVIQTKSPAGKDNTYIQSVQINGKTWNSFEFPFSMLANGGIMNIKLGDTPNKKWGVVATP
ncbi:GH92 family glycosyl hydrolase [Pedobacter nyackensis]|uniref:GH92 family glycosyl hydrolase n=1 Tax=Pedobacter nyackensis TaxID=475255 RepID=UPI002931050D|nr:GH92 family glycosyl hydrolase [Pedobacter nyackensis]